MGNLFLLFFTPVVYVPNDVPTLVDLHMNDDVVGDWSHMRGTCSCPYGSYKMASAFFLMSFMTLLPSSGIVAPNPHCGKIPCLVLLITQYLRGCIFLILLLFDEV